MRGEIENACAACSAFASFSLTVVINTLHNTSSSLLVVEWWIVTQIIGMLLGVFKTISRDYATRTFIPILTMAATYATFLSAETWIYWGYREEGRLEGCDIRFLWFKMVDTYSQG
jgi:hypothetical protein